MSTKRCENECPKCTSTNIQWKPKEMNGDVIYQSGTCMACRCEFKEYFEYAETEYEQ